MLRESKKSGELVEYLEIKHLPSGFRMYNTKSVYVRGLYFIESEAISKFVSQKKNILNDVSQLALIYEDAIQGIDIRNLEFIDFLELLVMISTMTVEDFGWVPNVKCVNIVDNPEKEQLQKEIEQAEAQLSQPDITDEVKKQLEEMIPQMYEMLEKLPEKGKCNTELKKPITLEDFDYEPVSITEPNIPVIIGQKECVFHPIRVKDIIEVSNIILDDDKISEYTKYGVDEDMIKKISYLAAMLETKDDKTIEQKIKLLLFSKPSDLKQLLELEKELNIKQKPIIRKCPKCGYPNKLYIGLETIKVYP